MRIPIYGLYGQKRNKYLLVLSLLYEKALFCISAYCRVHLIGLFYPLRDHNLFFVTATIVTVLDETI